MKKMSILLLISGASLFFTGCWKRKKIEENHNVKKTGIIIENDLVTNLKENGLLENDKSINAITYIDETDNLQVYSGKTIFADDENEISENEKEVNLLLEEEKAVDSFINQIEKINAEKNNSHEFISSQEQQRLAFLQKERMHLGVLNFEFDRSDDIKESAKDMLRSITNKLNELYILYPNMEVVIEGHACNSCGSERYNLELADERAKTIADKIFVTTSIPKERVFVFGCGTSHLIVQGNRLEQAPNRRAEIFVILNN